HQLFTLFPYTTLFRSYLLIPKFLFGTSFISKEIVDIFTEGPKKISLAGKTVTRMTADENEILGLLLQEKDALAVQLLFLRASRGDRKSTRLNSSHVKI